MKVIDWKKFAAFDYVNGEGSENNPYEQSDVVLDPRTNEIGVVIQVHDAIEFRTDMFGNTSLFEVVLADEEEISLHRPDIMSDIYSQTYYYVSDIDYVCDDMDVKLPKQITIWIPDHLNLEEKIDIINEQIANETGFMNEGFVCDPVLK